MDETAIQHKRRENEEQATRGRARILGLPYLDTREFERTIPLVPDILTKSEMRQNFIIPLQRGEGEKPYYFLITSQTPNSLITKMRDQYTAEGARVTFFLVSNAAYQTFMLRYDPPQEVHYDDIRIAKEGDSETISEVSKTLNSVSSDKKFKFSSELLIFISKTFVNKFESACASMACFILSPRLTATVIVLSWASFRPVRIFLLLPLVPNLDICSRIFIVTALHIC